MSRSAVTSLFDLRAADGGYVYVRCHCRREAMFEVADVQLYFRAMRWDGAWATLPARFRCSAKSPWGCGRTAEVVRFHFGLPEARFDRMPPLPERRR